LGTISKSGSLNYLNYLYGVNNVDYLTIESQFTVNVNSDKIATNARYSILTGIDNYPVTPNKILKVYIIPTSETSSRLKAGEFITKI
jgi:hypothetical protein